ncbi:hypothetical protein AKO1_015238 [Acrasis kona]|uniref:UVR domain-containing protein n=1 Tax=Acrasis kona TaxID=1008807 RepID=A0AAW2ZFA0_9EUKA
MSWFRFGANQKKPEEPKKQRDYAPPKFGQKAEDRTEQQIKIASSKASLDDELSLFTDMEVRSPVQLDLGGQMAESPVLTPKTNNIINAPSNDFEVPEPSLLKSRRLSNSSTTSSSSSVSANSSVSSRKSVTRATPIQVTQTPVEYDAPISTPTEKKRRRGKGAITIQESKPTSHSAYDEEKNETEADIINRLDHIQRIASIEVAKHEKEATTPVHTPAAPVDQQEYEEIEVEVEEEVEVDDDEEDQNDDAEYDLSKFGIPSNDEPTPVPKPESPLPKSITPILSPLSSAPTSPVDPPKKDKPSEFKKLVEATQVKFQELSKQASSIHTEIKKSLSDRTSSQTQLAALESDLERAENDLEQATNKEDFEKAHELDKHIHSLKQQIAKQHLNVTNQSLDFDALERKKRALPKQLRDVHYQFITKMNSIYDAEAKEVRDFAKEMDLKVRYSRERIDSEQDRLRRLEENARLDYDGIEKRKKRVQDEIDEEISDLKKTRQSSRDEMDNIDAQIVELEKKIIALKKQKRSHSTKFDASDVMIKKHEKRFELQLNSLIEEEKSAKQRLDACLMEKDEQESELSKLKNEINDLESIHQSNQHQLQIMNNKIKYSKLAMIHLERIESISKIDYKNSGSEIQDAKRAFDKLNHTYQESKIELESKSTLATSISKQISNATQSIPKLESEKKISVETRQFKEAARLNQEIKSKNLELDDLKQQYANVQQEKNALQEQFDRTDSKLKQQESTLQQLQIKEDTDRLKNHLIVNLIRIENAIVDIRQESNRDGDDDHHDDDDDGFVTGADLLKLELRDVESQVDELSDRIGLTHYDLQIIKDEIKSKQSSSSNDNSKQDLKTPTTIDATPDAATNTTQQAEPSKVEPTQLDDDDGESDPKILKSKVKNLRSELVDLDAEIEQAMANEDFERCAEIDEQQESIQSQIKSLMIQLASLGISDLDDDDHHEQDGDTKKSQQEEKTIVSTTNDHHENKRIVEENNHHDEEKEHEEEEGATGGDEVDHHEQEEEEQPSAFGFVSGGNDHSVQDDDDDDDDSNHVNDHNDGSDGEQEKSAFGFVSMDDNEGEEVSHDDGNHQQDHEREEEQTSAFGFISKNNGDDDGDDGESEEAESSAFGFIQGGDDGESEEKSAFGFIKVDDDEVVESQE